MPVRNSLMLASVISTTCVLVATPVSTASAASPKINKVTVSAKFGVWDDDSTIFGDSFDYATSAASKSYTVNSVATTQVDNVGIWSACSGGEVYGELHPTIMQTDPATGVVDVSYIVKLYEGSSCWSGDLDGKTRDWEVAHFKLYPGQTKTYNITQFNTDEGTRDEVDVAVTMHNEVS